ncbi:sensor domain-containing diguanylate cyclase [Paraburkholderia sp. BCC1886]|uniref:GGDEF domain-containing protein n=1 Tax=Paraburkholderia sp. BCC1886 TaxID=2562670 RepID=UPI0011821494|nr:GGDEF domain-containing protein [Paraburkholderia sp. BCC1886]
MHVDLITLYLLAIGTLLTSSCMTLWEARTHPGRARELRIFASAYAVLALGCLAAAFRRDLPGMTGSALSNLLIVSGYLLILRGAAALSRRRYGAVSVGMLIVLAAAWMLGGVPGEGVMWAYGSAVPIAVACGITARELWRSNGTSSVQSRHIAAVVSGSHALFYAFRSFILPWLANVYGLDFLIVVGKITMYEGVLYSVVLPMSLLGLVREEAHGQLLRESLTDYLTGLGNRRWFFEEGARVLRTSRESKLLSQPIPQPMSLLAFDLDHFKAINDRYGHESGDEVLKSFSRIARQVVGAETILARIGGEEFAALLPGVDGLRAKAVGEAVVQRFAVAVSHRSAGVEIHATVSIGLAHSTSDVSTLSDLLAAADEALYRAKSHGGNCLVTAGDGGNAGTHRHLGIARHRNTAVR